MMGRAATGLALLAAAAAQPAAWFLTEAELGAARGGAARDGPVFSEGNAVDPYVGKGLMARVYDEVAAMEEGDVLRSTNWLTGPDWELRPEMNGTETRIGYVFQAAARRRVNVSNLVWIGRRPIQPQADIDATKAFVDMMNEAGPYGQARADDRQPHPRFGSQHQKTYVMRRNGVTTSCVGGIDITKDRWDVRGQNTSYPARPGMPAQAEARALRLLSQGGQAGLPGEPGWRDMSVCVTGPGALDVDASFTRRWNNAAAGSWLHPCKTYPEAHPTAAAPLRGLPGTNHAAPDGGSVAVQLLETYACDYACYASFAPKGDQTALRGFVKAIDRAERFVHIEDQYAFLLEDIQEALQRFLRREPEGKVVWFVQYPQDVSVMTTLFYFMWQPLVAEFGTARVKAYYRLGEVYLHTKLRVVDDTWAFVGSQNLNRRSYGYDSEIGVAMVDAATASRGGRTVGRAPHAIRMNSLEDNSGVPASEWENMTIEEAMARLDAVAAAPEAQPKIGNFATSIFNASYAPAWYMKGEVGKLVRDLADPYTCGSGLLGAAAAPGGAAHADLRAVHAELTAELAGRAPSRRAEVGAALLHSLGEALAEGERPSQ